MAVYLIGAANRIVRVVFAMKVALSMPFVAVDLEKARCKRTVAVMSSALRQEKWWMRLT